MTTKLEFRTLAPDDSTHELAEMLAAGFGLDEASARDWLAGMACDRVRVVRRGGETVAGHVVFDGRQYFGGCAVPTRGVAGVIVRPDMTRRGIATFMMQKTLAEARERGGALSTLYASNQPLYRKVGYEQSGARFLGKVKPQEIQVTERGLVARSFAGREAEIMALYDRVAAPQNGHMARCDYLWPRSFRPRYGKRTWGAVFEDESGAVEAYVLFRMGGESIDRHPVDIVDMEATTLRGVRSVWAHLADVGTLVSEYRFPTSPVDPFYPAHPHPYATMRHFENWMIRVVDPKAAIECRGYAPDLTVEFDLTVRSSAPDLDASRLHVAIEGGRAVVTASRGGGLEVSTRGLAPLFTGHLPPSTLVALGHLGGAPGDLAKVAAAFAGSAPWMRDFF